jgi:hypothetical protein
MRRSVVGLLCVAAAAVCMMCGGTTGREGLPALAEGDDATAAEGGDATIGSGEAGDASDDDSTGTFDVVILYADRVLPDVSAPVDAGEGGYPWPDCPPFVPVALGKPVSAGADQLDQIPAAFDDAGAVLLDDAGRVVGAPDGSVCASYGWLGTTAIDECDTSNNSGSGSVPPILLPPCNWCVDAGTAAAGPRSGAPRYDVCRDLYACMRRTGCGLAADGFNVTACLCGDASTTTCTTPQGACGLQELGALEIPLDPDPTNQTAAIQTALAHYTEVTPSKSFYCGSSLNALWQSAITGNGVMPCFPADAGPF